MHTSDRLYMIAQKLLRRNAKAAAPSDGTSVEADEAADLLREHNHELGRIFFSHRGKAMQKWTQYLDAYNTHLEPYKNHPVRLLEIGVNQGGSLQMWRSYFGDAATLFGVDLNPDCAKLAEAPTQIRIGSQADPEFLHSVIAEMGRPDIVIDDGSHVAAHQHVSFKVLFPSLNPGGLYVIEDLHTAYWRGEFGGGYKRPGTGIELVKQLIDDMHGWWYRRKTKLANREDIASIHIYDSVAFIKKGPRIKPRHARVGQLSD